MQLQHLWLAGGAVANVCVRSTRLLGGIAAQTAATEDVSTVELFKSEQCLLPFLIALANERRLCGGLKRLAWLIIDTGTPRRCSL